MRSGRILTGLAASFLIMAGIFMFSDGRIRAQGPDPEAAISRKLGEILENQKRIIQGIESLKSEINILKIRITQQQ